eukprot:9479578-Pyramimonas_sp.AAC.1
MEAPLCPLGHQNHRPFGPSDGGQRELCDGGRTSRQLAPCLRAQAGRRSEGQAVHRIAHAALSHH